jgi:hypothetical protein
MKFIKKIHDLIDILTKKGKTGYHPRVDIDTAVYSASKDLFDKEYILFQANQKITDSLLPFISDPTALTLDVLGKSPKPDDYLHLTGLTSGSTMVEVQQIDQAFIGKKLNDPLCPPTLDYPIVVLYKSYFQFYPINQTNVKITYLKPPIEPVYAYTIVDGREVYDDTNSVDVEWNETDHNKLAMGALKILGVNLDDQFLFGYADNEVKERG